MSPWNSETDAADASDIPIGMRSMERRRFVIVAATTAASLFCAASPVRAANSAMRNSRKSGVPTDLEPNLVSAAVMAFIANPDVAVRTFAGPVPPGPTGFVDVSQRPGDSETMVSSIDEYGVSQQLPITLVAVRREHYNVMEGTKQVGAFTVDVVITEQVRLSVVPHLYVNAGAVTAAQQAQMITAFTDYRPTMGDPTSYAYTQAARLAIAPESFAVTLAYQLTKLGTRVEHTEERDAKLSLYKDQNAYTDQNRSTKGSILPFSPGGDLRDLKADFVQRDIRTVHVPTLTEFATTTPTIPDRHIVEGHEGISPVNDLVAGDVLGASADCAQRGFDVGHPVSARIATVMVYPEFKIRMEPVTVRIGCVLVKFDLPALYVRKGSQVLWAYVVHATNPVSNLVGMLEACAIQSALAGAVIGVVLGNFAAGLAAFQALFEECIERAAVGYAKCLLPSLALVKDYTRWARAV